MGEREEVEVAVGTGETAVKIVVMTVLELEANAAETVEDEPTIEVVADEVDEGSLDAKT